MGGVPARMNLAGATRRLNASKAGRADLALAQSRAFVAEYFR
ncbi:MAG: hypothetical protein JWO94_71 [Verrucomicrobiaceae bacterium]|nr:hypothetical protein [Verrucomicrobiaceae bacterium]